MKLTKRLLAMLLLVCMVFSMLPAIALTASAAAGSDTLTANNIKGGSALSGSYGNFTYTSSTTGAVYKGNACKQTDIQIKKGTIGFYVDTPAPGCVISSFTATVTAGTLEVYGNTNASGSPLASSSSSISCNPNTEYICLKANGTTKISTMTITWAANGAKYKVTYSQPSGGTFTVKNGNTTVNSGDEVAENTELTLTATPNSNYTFTRWNVSGSSAPANTAANPATIKITGNTTISATFSPKTVATLTYSENGTTHSASIGTKYVGDSVTLDAPTTSTLGGGYEFVGWLPSTYAESDTEPTGLLEEGDSYTLSAASNTLYAVYTRTEGGSGGGSSTYQLVTSASDLVVGSSIVIAAKDYNFAISTTQNTNNRGQDSITKSGNTITLGTDVSEFTLEAGTTTGTYSFKDSNGYLYAASSSKNYLRSEQSKSDNSSWTISISNGTASVVANGSNSNKTMQYNQGSSIFSCYSSASQKALVLYQKTGSSGTTYYTTTVNTEATFYTLTYSVSPASSGTIACDVNSNTQVEEGTDVTLTAAAAEHFTFASWTVTGTTDYVEDGDELLVTMTDDVTVTANFTAEPTYTVTVTPAAGGTMTASKTSGIYAGETITLTATPDEHYTFNGWQCTAGGASISGNSFTMPAANVTVTGSFTEAAQYTVTFYDKDGHVAATKTYYAGETIPASDVPSIEAPDGFVFKNWCSANYSNTTEPTYTAPAGATVNGNLEFHAVYAELGEGGTSETFKLYITKSGSDYYIGTHGSNTYFATASTESNAIEFGVEDGEYLYCIDGGTKYYVYNTADNTTTSFTTEKANATKWTITDNDDTIQFQSKASGGRYLALNTNPYRFSTYGSSYSHVFTKIGGASVEGYTTNPVSTKISVTWMNGTETFKSEKVAYGDSITAPTEAPEKTEAEQEYYTFAGWSETEGGTVITSFPTASAQLGDKTYYAVFTTNQKLTVTWKNYDNTTLDTDYCKSGDTPAYTGTEPTKPADSSFYYTFSGWTPTVSAITSSITYTATFERHDRFEMSASLSKPSVKVGSTATLNYTITDMGEETDDYTPTVTIADTSVATYNSSTGKITGVSVGSTTVTVTVPGCLDANGDPLTQTINLTVTEGSVGGYTLMTKDNAPDDWTGDYIIMGRLSAYLDYLNSYQILTPKWEDGSAIVEDGNGSTVAQNNASLVTLVENGETAEGTIDSAYVEGDTISMEATGDNDFGTHTIYDRITEIDDSYAFTFERIGDSDIYTIRVKGTNYYLANTNTTVSGNNGMQYVTTSDVNDTTMLWKIRWATAGDGLTATNGYTPDVLLIESVYGLENGVSRCILFNNMGKPETASNITGARFRVYGENAYHSNTTSLAGGSNGISYNIYLFGNPNPFKPQIYHLGDQITIANAGEISNTNATTLVTSALFPDINDYPNWSQVGDPAWSIVEKSTGNAMTIASDGTITLNGSTAGSYALVQVTYTVHDVINNVNHDVSTIAKIVVTAPTYTYSTVIYETLSNNDTEVQYTVNNRVSELPLAAYVVNDDTGDNSKTGNVVKGGTLSWSASVASSDGTATIGADGILHLSGFTTDGIVNVTVSGATGNGTSATDATYKVYVKAINYTTTIVNDGDTGSYNSSTDTITYSGSENEGKLAYNVVNADGYNQDDGVFNLYGGSWAISGNAYGATINNTTGYLNFSGVNRSEEHTITVLVSHLTATEGDTTTPNLSDTITVVIGARVEEDTLDAVDDLVIVDYALPVTFNVLTNDNINVEVVVTAGTLPSGVENNGSGSFTYTPSGWQTTDQTFTYTIEGTVNGSAATDIATVTLKTADSIYYEDTYSGIFNFTGNWTDLTDGTAIAAQTSSLDTADIFEHDANYESYAMYSGGTAKSTTVVSGMAAANRPSVSFTFAGTGFDVISATTNNGGAVLMTITGAGGNAVRDEDGRNLNAIYDNFRGYVYCEEAYTRYTLVQVKRCDADGTPNPTGAYYYDRDNNEYKTPVNNKWYALPNGDTGVYYTIQEAETFFASDESASGTYIIKEYQSHWLPYEKGSAPADTYNTNFYQIPIMKITGLTYGTYTVTLKPIYSSAYDRAGDGSYDFIFDGVRIHNPVANRAAEYKYISIHDAVKAGEGFGSGKIVACDHQGHEWSDWTFCSRARNTASTTTTNRGSFVQYCSYCGGVANTAYFHVAVTADYTELGVGGYGGRSAEAVLSYTLDADESSQPGVEAEIQAKLDAINGRLSQRWESNSAAVMNCTNFGNIAVASGEGTTYATLQLKDPSGTIYASAIHSPMITVYENKEHVHTFGDWTHDENSDPGTHTHTCTGENCSFYERENCVFTEVVTTQPTQTTPGSKTCTCALCSYSYVAEIPALGGHTATFHVPADATAPAAQTGSSVTMPAAVAAPADYDAHSYTFVGWVESTVSDTTTEQTFYAPGYEFELNVDMDFYALYTYGGNAGGYTLSSTAPQAGDSVIIAAEKDGTYYAMPQDSFTGEALTVSGNNATNVDGLTWTAYDASYSGSTGIGFNNGTNPLHMNSSALKVASGDQNGTFEFTASGDGFIVYSNQNTRWLKYNGTSFGVASDASGATPVVFFISSGATYYTTNLAATCTHTDTTTTTVNPTCTVAGSTTVTCDDCDEVISVTPIAALGHNYTSSVSGSVTTYTCSRCGDTYTEDSNFAASYILQDGLSVVGGSRSGNVITLPTGISGMDAYDAHSYTFVGWATESGAASGTQPTLCTSPVTITEDTSFYPVYSYGSGGSNYEKVTATSALTNGQYLIVYENGSVAFNSALTTLDAVSNTISVTISDGKIASNTTTDAAAFTFDSSNGSFKGTGGKYFGNASNSNALTSSPTALSNTVSIDSGNAVIVSSGGAYLRYNAASDQTRFRYYKSGTYTAQQAIQLYKKGAGGSSTTTYTFELEKNTVVDTYAGTVTASPSRIELSTGTATVSSTLKKNGTAMAAGDYSVTYALSSGSAASLSGTTVSAGANSGNVTVTATFTVGGSTVDTATCNVTVYDPNAEVTVNYIGSQTGKVYNWGTRGTTATFLTEMADNYYTGSYSYETLSALSGDNGSGTAFYTSALGTAIHNMLDAKQTNTTSYAGTTSLYAYTDCVESGNKISSYYSAALIGPTWDSGSTWNREHTWPNSKGLDGSDENDIMMLRPTAKSENSSRGNNAYGESGGYYDPNREGQNLHGDVARLMLQHLMRWGNTSKFYGTGGVMESRAILLKWLAEDPVDTWEMGRNDAVQRITGVRNVFVDYPELAFILLGANVPANYTTPSASDIVAAATYSATKPAGYEPVTEAANTPNSSPRATAPASARTSISPGSFNGAVIIDGKGTANTFDDFAAYGPEHGVYLAPGQGIVFSLVSDIAITSQDLQIGAKAVNGTATKMDVASISNGTVSTGIKYLLDQKPIASATEMYYELDTTQMGWNGTESSVLVIYNSGSGVLDVTNIRYSTVNGNTLTMNINEVQTQRAAKMIQIVYGEPITDPDPIEPTDLDLNFASAELVLNSDIAINFNVEEEVMDSADGIYAVFTKALYNNAGEITGYYDATVNEATYNEETGKYTFRFTGINPAEMGSAVTATLYGYRDGELVSGETVNYSVLTYINNMYGKVDNAEFRALLADLAAYGEAAQNYVSYNTANLVTDATVEGLDAYATKAAPELNNATAITGDGAVKFTGAYLSLREKVTVCYMIDASEYAGDIADLELRIYDGKNLLGKISGADFAAADGKYIASFSGLNALQMRTVVTAEVYDGDTCVSNTLDYSIESYCSSKAAGSDALAALVNALMSFGISAEAYFDD